jgi:hypothetical protein
MEYGVSKAPSYNIPIPCTDYSHQKTESERGKKMILRIGTMIIHIKSIQKEIVAAPIKIDTRKKRARSF